MLMPDKGINLLPKILADVVCRINRKRGGRLLPGAYVIRPITPNSADALRLGMGTHNQTYPFTEHPGQQGLARFVDSVHVADVNLHVPHRAVLSPLLFQFRHGFVG
jgi:hypothetical protein